MARGMSPMKIIGFILLIAGVVLLAVGIYQFVEFRDSVGGKVASGVNKLLGNSKVAKGYQQPIILMVCGVVSAAAGYFVSKRG